jgi:hypothetical protein
VPARRAGEEGQERAVNAQQVRLALGRVAGPRWLEATISDPPRRIPWLPLLQRGPQHPDEAAGLCPDGTWVEGAVRASGDRPPRAAPVDPLEPLGLLPILE